MFHFRSTSIIVALVFLGSSAPAQQPPSPVQPDNPWSIETVVVTAKSTGPAIWRASNGKADVAILGIVEPVPVDFQWNTKPLGDLLDHARFVMLPPRVDVPFFPGLWFLLTERSLLHPPEGKTLWDLLDPHVAARFAAMRDMLHEDKDHYDDLAPGPAALRLENDFRHVYMLTTHEPVDKVRWLARTRRVAAHYVAYYDALPSAEELLNLPPATIGKCVDAAVSDVEIESKHATAAAEAWAVGNVAGMEANWSQPKLYDCMLELSTHATALDKRAIDDTVDDITDALEKGGHTVAVVDIGILLRKGGVLERLLASGISVTAPGA